MTNSIWPHYTSPGERLYVIGDIHGQMDLLKKIYDRILFDLKERPAEIYKIISLGDIVDRGESSKSVIDFLMAQVADHHCIVLRGNHEDMLLKAIGNSEAFSEWRRYGGLETIMSFGVPVQSLMKGRDIPQAQSLFREKFGQTRQAFIESLPLTYHSGSYLFCHAGIRPDISINSQIPRDLMWIRDEFLQHSDPYEKFIIHGHTPVDSIDLRTNRMNIDTGAYLSGRLTCVILEANHAFSFDSKNEDFTSIF